LLSELRASEKNAFIHSEKFDEKYINNKYDFKTGLFDLPSLKLTVDKLIYLVPRLRN